MPMRCRWLKRGSVHIPTHVHIANDMRPRAEGVVAALKALGLS